MQLKLSVTLTMGRRRFNVRVQKYRTNIDRPVRYITLVNYLWWPK